MKARAGSRRAGRALRRAASDDCKAIHVPRTQRSGRPNDSVRMHVKSRIGRRLGVVRNAIKSAVQHPSSRPAIALINWVYYPKSAKATPLALAVVEAFVQASDVIDSTKHELPSNGVLAEVAAGLTRAGFIVETGKRATEKISVPVLFGLNGRLDKTFDADAYHQSEGFVVEVEAGRGVVNNQFLKDLFQACMMHEVRYLATAVRNVYRRSPDFERVLRFFDTLYASNRLRLPLEGILIVGY
jgi:hypothetical protein